MNHLERAALSETQKPLINVLCLDGGGVRGLSSLLMLREIMRELQNRSGAPTLPRPCEVFDLICGTSTGGLIALMLGRLRMDIDAAITAYVDLSKDIFGKREYTWFALYHMFRVHALYSAAALEKCIKEVVAAHDHTGQDALLEDSLDGTDELCRTFVVSVSQSLPDAPPKLFRTYATQREPADTCTIWEAARATTAATTFFSPVTIGRPPERYIDGALGGDNNPSRLALEEIWQLFPGRQIGCFLSLGTGVPDVFSIKGDISKIGQACVGILTSCERVHNSMGLYFSVHYPLASPYFRFSVAKGFGKMKLDEWNRVAELAGITAAYMNSHEQREKAESCVACLTQRVGKFDDGESKGPPWVADVTLCIAEYL